jgi:hypothetical protein
MHEQPSPPDDSDVAGDSQGSERADIARRVANFKAHQAKLQRDREDYYDSVRARVDRALNLSKPRDVAGSPE